MRSPRNDKKKTVVLDALACPWSPTETKGSPGTPPLLYYLGRRGRRHGRRRGRYGRDAVQTSISQSFRGQSP